MQAMCHSTGWLDRTFAPESSRPQTTVQISRKANKNCRLRINDKHTDWQTDARDFITCPMLCYSNGTDKDLMSNGPIELTPGNPAVYDYKFIIFFLLYIYASNHASEQCTKCAVMLCDENIHTLLTKSTILCRIYRLEYGCHAHRLRTYLWHVES